MRELESLFNDLVYQAIGILAFEGKRLKISLKIPFVILAMTAVLLGLDQRVESKMRSLRQSRNFEHLHDDPTEVISVQPENLSVSDESSFIDRVCFRRKIGVRFGQVCHVGTLESTVIYEKYFIVSLAGFEEVDRPEKVVLGKFD